MFALNCAAFSTILEPQFCLCHKQTAGILHLRVYACLTDGIRYRRLDRTVSNHLGNLSMGLLSTGLWSLEYPDRCSLKTEQKT